MIAAWKPFPGPQTEFCSRWEFEALYGGSAGPGKGLALDTQLATPYGWTTMGKVEIGDSLFDEQGNVCNVVAVSPIHNRVCYRITFDDGSKIIADDVHKWSILTPAALAMQTRKQETWRAKRRSERKKIGTGKRDDLSILNMLRGGKLKNAGPWEGAQVIATTEIKTGHRKYAIPVSGALMCQNRTLPIVPYVLGAWIGDGTSASAGISCDENNPWVINTITDYGYSVNKWSGKHSYGINGIASKLTELHLKKNKHIPQIYLRSSIQQRRELLAGLMDTDGHVSKDGTCELTTVSSQLAQDYYELVVSLGYKATKKIKRTTCQTGASGLAYRIAWSGMDTPVLDPKKRANLRCANRPTIKRRYIVSVEKIDSVPTKCIAVDSPNRLYLAGESMIPTHNTDCLIAEALRYVHVPQYNALILRRTFPMLQEIIDRTRSLYPQLGGEYRTGEHRWYFPSGARVNLGHVQHDGDEYNYQGKEYQFIGFDEATQFLARQYLYLFSRCRSSNPDIPCRIRAATNPGGAGHQFIKDRFRIGHIPSGVTYIDPDTKLSRVFIQGRLSDNPALLANDPDYVKRLMQLPEIERMRLMEGIWDAFEGQAFRELNVEIHGFDYDCPKEWPRYRSFDWGYATPFSVGWWAIDPDGVPHRYREWYGTKEPGTNEGLRMSPQDIARGIREREQGEKINPGPADPDIWNPRWKTMGKNNKFGVIGGSVMEDMANEGVHWIQADNDRILGRQQVHKRLQLDENGQAQIRIHTRNCPDFWRTMPLMREHHINPEDLESKDVEDHIYSETRYMCMFRPMRPSLVKKDDAGSFQAERRKLIRARQLAASRGISLQQAWGKVR